MASSSAAELLARRGVDIPEVVFDEIVGKILPGKLDGLPRGGLQAPVAAGEEERQLVVAEVCALLADGICTTVRGRAPGTAILFDVPSQPSVSFWLGGGGRGEEDVEWRA